MITIFRDIIDTSTPFYVKIEDVLDRIKDSGYKDIISEIRNESDKDKRNIIKKKLPAICFSGKFRTRNDKSLMAHSGIICLDFDGYADIDAVADAKAEMCADPYVMACFISPSGKGLKVLVKIPDDNINHKKYFNALGKHFDSDHFDMTSSNVSRVCYESYDSDLYVNMDSEKWTDIIDVDSNTNYDVTVQMTNSNKIVDILMRWWSKKYGFVEGSRNNNLFILACAMNEYGITESDCLYHFKQSFNFDDKEMSTLVWSAYKNTSAFRTKFFDDADTVYSIHKDVTSGMAVSDIKDKYRDVKDIEDVVTNIEKKSHVKKFWSKTDKGVISIVHYVFKDFLEDNGFFRYIPDDGGKATFVKVTNSLIDICTVDDIKSFVLGYLSELDDLSIFNFFAERTKYFREEFLNLLDNVKVHFIIDTVDKSYLYFNNCVLEVSGESVSTIDYIDLSGFVWRNQIIDRDYVSTDDKDCDFKRFVSNICGGVSSNVKSLESTIGFLMSGYKDPSYCPAIILNDEMMTDNPEGGTGKGLFVSAISQMKSLIKIDGKHMSHDDKFVFQRVNKDTQVISFDDVKKNFEFEKLFSVITEGITFEKKYMGSVHTSFADSPKIVITTNYIISGKGNSFDRRKFELEFTQHYHKDWLPFDDFGRRLFDDWDDMEWNKFYSYMISNLQLFIRSGLIKFNSSTMDIKKLGKDTCHEFLEWVGLIEGTTMSSDMSFNKKLFKDNLYHSFIKDNPDFAPRSKMAISRILFYKWLFSYGDYMENITVDDGRSSLGQWIIFKTESDDCEQKQEDPSFDF